MGCVCTPIERNGYHYNEFIAENFGECLYTPREVASFFVGMSSLLFWFISQTPQFIKNYKNKSGQALSKWFLLEWFLGDALNLVGCILTKQLVTQVATSTLFIMMDLSLIAQLFYYARCYNRNKFNHPHRSKPNSYADISSNQIEDIEEEELENEPLINHEYTGLTNAQNSNIYQSLAAFTLPLLFIFIKDGSASDASVINLNMQSEHSTLRGLNDQEIPSCEQDPSLSPFRHAAGTLIGWISAVVYLNSRIPQLIKNYRRRSVDGLSWLMFFCAVSLKEVQVMGNTTYGLGVILKDSSANAIHKAFPWLVGSLGTLFLDFFIIVQFCIYPSKTSLMEDAIDYESIQETNEPVQIPRGLHGINAWTNSPLFRPLIPSSDMVPLRNNASLGILPSQIPRNMASSATSSDSQIRQTSQDLSRADSF